MTPPSSAFTASDGTEWQFYDCRLEHAGERRVLVKAGSDRATHRMFKAGDGPVYCYRFSAAFDYRDTEPRTLERQIADAVAMREAGTR